ncbi:MAG TPA: hypothetical protein DCP31_36010, partial [Cyanobacteria bacterium UBA8543]|nr:hypothetical protein [Cyanobacteria bacterium UBA8543]
GVRSQEAGVRSQESDVRSQKSGVIPTITIRTEVSNQKNILNSGSYLLNSPFIIIRIADNGAGISEEVQQKIFDPFFTTKPVGSGTGLGLSICHQIVVEKHKGKINCISAPGQGTKLIVEIPDIKDKEDKEDTTDFLARVSISSSS